MGPSVYFDAGRPDDRGPFFGFGGNELAELRWRPTLMTCTQRFHCGLKSLRLHCFVHRSVDRFDNVARRYCRCDEPRPEATEQIRDAALARRRDLRHLLEATI